MLEKRILQNMSTTLSIYLYSKDSDWDTQKVKNSDRNPWNLKPKPLESPCLYNCTYFYTLIFLITFFIMVSFDTWTLLWPSANTELKQKTEVVDVNSGWFWEQRTDHNSKFMIETIEINCRNNARYRLSHVVCLPAS